MIFMILFKKKLIKICTVEVYENFDNHSVGNLGTDVTGKIPGQWGWYTASEETQTNSFLPL